MPSQQKRILEKTIATASFVVAVALSFTSLLIGKEHDIAANVCLVVAQFLTLTATLLGIDYKFSAYGHPSRNQKQQSTESPNQ